MHAKQELSECAHTETAQSHMMNRCTSYFFLRIRIPYSFFPGTIRHCGHILVMTQGVINHRLELIKRLIGRLTGSLSVATDIFN
jgi:hypothetical protein